jgi:hypothetical protein
LTEEAPEEEVSVAEPVSEEPSVEPIVAEAELEIAEIEEEPAAPLTAEEAQWQAERERALAQIPADAYDIPLMLLALNSDIQNVLTEAEIENLGQIMERLIDGDDSLLSLEGIGPEELTEIKNQVELMVSVPSQEPEDSDAEEEEEKRRQEPRYEYVADDEIERKMQSKRKKSRRRRQRAFNEFDDLEELDDVVPSRKRGREEE